MSQNRLVKLTTHESHNMKCVLVLLSLVLTCTSEHLVEDPPPHPSTCNLIPNSSKQRCLLDKLDEEAYCPSSTCKWCPSRSPDIPSCIHYPDAQCVSDTKPRSDCHPEPGADRSKCVSRGCHWCPIDGYEAPWCIHASDSICTGHPKVDCGADSQESCITKGCHWCPYETDAPCIHDPSSVCVTLQDDKKVDCLGSSREFCEASGCHWCPSSHHGVPWCFFDPHADLEGSCPDVPLEERMDCHPDEHPTMARCISRGCFLCPISDPGIPDCIYNSTSWPPIPQGDNFRIDCHPELGVSDQRCHSRGCIFQPSDQPGAPWCYLPLTHGYILKKEPEVQESGYLLTLQRIPSPCVYGKCVDIIYMQVDFNTESQLRIKIFDGTSRYEVPLKMPEESLSRDDPKRLYDVTFVNKPYFSIQVVRRETGTVLFDTSIGGLVFSNQYLQIATFLPSKNVYGFGENEQSTFRHNLNWKTWAMWARDQPPHGDANMYGVHPHYTVLEEDGRAHGVLILNANAQEVSLMPTPALTYRTIGGIIDLYFFLGPTPENTVQQYTKAIGRYPLPPYWSLGFHLSRYGYNSIQSMREVIDRNQAAQIPQDVQYGDIDIMDRRLDFTYDEKEFAGLPEYVTELRASGIRIVAILDPAISIGEKNGTYRPYDLGCEMDVWVKTQDGIPVTARVWPSDPVNFPDFTNPKAHQWWATLLKEFKMLIDWDGIWIDMNEPANFVTGDLRFGCPVNQINNPPYKPRIRGTVLSDHTLCMDHKQVAGLHYNLHNLYGWSQSEATYNSILAAVPGKRPFILSRSTFVGSGKWTTHWLGDNFSNWPNLRHSIVGVLQFNQFGMPLVGPDVCGFIGDSTAELCERWMQLGAFYPYSRNHNAIGAKDQDPAVWGPRIANSSRDALEIRYTLLPYLYLLFYQHHIDGSTVARALWHEFPHDPRTWDIDYQFMWGSALLISPVVTQGSVSVQAYFPHDVWYSYYNGEKVTPTGKTLTLAAPRNFIPLHVRGGSIIPTQEPAMNTMISRQKPLGLIIALHDDNVAKGVFYYDDGEDADTIERKKYFLAEFRVEQHSLQVHHIHDGYPDLNKLVFGTIRIFGADEINHVTVNGSNHTDFVQREDTKELTITKLNIPANMKFTVEWAYLAKIDDSDENME